MSPDKIKELIQKYEAGMSTLEEEQFLLEQAKHEDTGMAAWATYVKHKKSKVPQNLNEDLWASFEKKTNTKRRYLYWLTAAVSVLFVLGIWVAQTTEKIQSLAEKKALLEEARSMLAPTPQKMKIENEIIYEDDILIIYNKIETPIN